MTGAAATSLINYSRHKVARGHSAQTPAQTELCVTTAAGELLEVAATAAAAAAASTATPLPPAGRCLQLPAGGVAWVIRPVRG